jgi:hypothetical protein
MTVNRTRAFLRDELGLPAGDAFDLATSGKRFEDGGQYRVELPSVEGPAALQAVGAKKRSPAARGPSGRRPKPVGKQHRADGGG